MARPGRENIGTRRPLQEPSRAALYNPAMSVLLLYMSLAAASSLYLGAAIPSAPGIVQCRGSYFFGFGMPLIHINSKRKQIHIDIQGIGVIFVPDRQGDASTGGFI